MRGMSADEYTYLDVLLGSLGPERALRCRTIGRSLRQRGRTLRRDSQIGIPRCSLRSWRSKIVGSRDCCVPIRGDHTTRRGE